MEDKLLRIKTGAVSRLTKEIQQYMTEKETLHEKIRNCTDEYVIRKTEEQLDETETVLQDTMRSLQSYTSELSDLLDRLGVCGGSGEESARSILERARNQLGVN